MDFHLPPFASITRMKQVSLWLPCKIHHDLLGEEDLLLPEHIFYLVFMKRPLKVISQTKSPHRGEA